jgi:hypothetical protein
MMRKQGLDYGVQKENSAWKIGIFFMVLGFILLVGAVGFMNQKLIAMEDQLTAQGAIMDEMKDKVDEVYNFSESQMELNDLIIKGIITLDERTKE